MTGPHCLLQPENKVIKIDWARWRFKRGSTWMKTANKVPSTGHFTQNVQLRILCSSLVRLIILASARTSKQPQSRTSRKLCSINIFIGSIFDDMVIDILQICCSASALPELREASKKNGPYWFTRPRIPPVSGPWEEDQARFQLQPKPNTITTAFPYR